MPPSRSLFAGRHTTFTIAFATVHCTFVPPQFHTVCIYCTLARFFQTYFGKMARIRTFSAWFSPSGDADCISKTSRSRHRLPPSAIDPVQSTQCNRPSAIDLNRGPRPSLPKRVASRSRLSSLRYVGVCFTITKFSFGTNNLMTTTPHNDTTTQTMATDAVTTPDRRRWSLRGFTSLFLSLSFTVLCFSGVLLFLTPRGRTANWTDWSLLGLDKHQWGALHVNNSILFIVAAVLHLILNWSLFANYIKRKAGRGLHMKKEMALATMLAAVCIVGPIWSVPPFGSLMTLNEEVKKLLGPQRTAATRSPCRRVHRG